MNAETDHQLAGEPGNSRNGYGITTVLTDTGRLDLAIPRDRKATFGPQLIAKYQRRLPGFDEVHDRRRGRASGLAVRHDHRSQFMSTDFKDELRFLGIASSPAFVRAPDGNGCAERFTRTLKENLPWAPHIDTVEELRQALLGLRDTYNTTWLSSGTGSRPPPQSGSGSFNPPLSPHRLQSGA